MDNKITTTAIAIRGIFAALTVRVKLHTDVPSDGFDLRWEELPETNRQKWIRIAEMLKHIKNHL